MDKNLYNKFYGSFVASQKGYSGFRNRLRLKIYTELTKPAEDERILEIGCNDGLFLNHLSTFTDFAYGIDVNEEQIENQRNDRIKYMQATDIKYSDVSFDKVVSFETIEHIANIKKVLSEVGRILKPNGKFIFSFPLELIRGQQAFMDAIIVHKNLLYARKLHIHKLFPYKIKNIIKDMPFSIKMISLKFIPFPSYVMILLKT
jgi:2-polyprenyl-3-methyl-5-hydroxy-6-metoxy-1,4-benzoquinol methylase